MIAYHLVEPVVEGIHEFQFIAVGRSIFGRVGLSAKDTKVASIRQLYVAPDSRKQGIGKELVRLCIYQAATEGCESINLTVAKSNEQVIPFYKKLGFILCADFGDEVWMCRPIHKKDKELSL